MTFYLIIGAIMLASWLVSNTLKARMAQYNQIPIRGNYTGAEITEKMLRDHGINDVTIKSVPGQLTDHYNPKTKSINLSQGVYSGRSIAAASIAAHETGHAIQHATAYQWLQLRSQMVPVVSIASNLVQWALLAGIALYTVFPQLIYIALGLFALTVLFAFITLPVEFDASRRATAWLENSGVADAQTLPKAKDGLKWAARTYVVAALGSLAMLFYYILVFTGRRD